LFDYHPDDDMQHSPHMKQNLLVATLIAGALVVLALIYFSPVWWVSLTAPNYPAEAFPDGVRIHFHMNGVFSGCKKVEKVEISEEEALDCVHEMDTINHYVGMYPIAAGAPVERGYSQFLVCLVAIMLTGFMITSPGLRMAVMAAGFVALAAWMYLTFYGAGGIALENEGYVAALVTALDQGAGDRETGDQDKGDEMQSSGQAMIELLRRSLEESGVTVETPSRPKSPAAEGDMTRKAILIDNLRVTFEKDQARRAAPAAWHGDGLQVLTWHYDKTLGRYFNNRAEVEPMVTTLRLALVTVFWLLIASMPVLLWGARKNRGLLYWLLVLAPMSLPLLFLVDYSAWLWWFGHNLNEMGAFTVKPFMPTVFGDGKVAQFTTHSYPTYGFGLMLLFSILLALAALIRRKQLKTAAPERA
jgi:hypothetical protein